MKVLCSVAAAALVVSSVSGCSSKTKGTPSTSSAASTSAATPTTESSSVTGLPTQDQVDAALLKASDVGAAFTDGTYTKTDNSMPCAGAGTPSFRKQTSPAIDGGATLESPSLKAALDEQIFVYADAATAQQALAVAKGGLNCPNGKSYSANGTASPITIGPPTDVAAALGVDAGFAWQLHNATVQGTAAAIEIGPVILTLTFGTVAGADTSKLPDVLAIAKAAVAKLKSS